MSLPASLHRLPPLRSPKELPIVGRRNLLHLCLVRRWNGTVERTAPNWFEDFSWELVRYSARNRAWGWWPGESYDYGVSAEVLGWIELPAAEQAAMAQQGAAL